VIVWINTCCYSLLNLWYGSNFIIYFLGIVLSFVYKKCIYFKYININKSIYVIHAYLQTYIWPFYTYLLPHTSFSFLCLFEICYDLFFIICGCFLVLEFVTCIWWFIVGLKFKLEAIWIWANSLNWIIDFLESKRVIYTLHLLRHMVFISPIFQCKSLTYINMNGEVW